jgi:hypothetical protein
MTIDALLSKPREPLPRGPLATQALNLQIADHAIQCLRCLIQHSMLPHDIHDSRNDMLKRHVEMSKNRGNIREYQVIS